MIFFKKRKKKLVLKSNKDFSIMSIPLFSISVFIFSEWLFMVTKPSFMSGMTFFDKLNILFLSNSVLIFCFLLPLLFCILFVEKIFRIKKLFKLFATAISSFILTCLVLLLIDNFTYTLFSFGVVTTRSIFRLAYLFFLIYVFFKIFKKARKLIVNVYFYKIFILYIFFLFSFFIFNIFSNKSNFEGIQLGLKNNNFNYPNIVFITADGVNASNMSLYGYKRKTTPNIDELAKTSLVANNMFTNSANTLGSIVSLFTGKHPMETRVIYTPDILNGKDTIEHLPILLRKVGYLGYQYSDANFADVFSANMISGFNYANGREENTNKLFISINKYLGTNVSYFISDILNKIKSRYKHLLLIENMTNVKNVIEGEFANPNDWEKFDNMINILREKQEPVFIHTHWMGTHGSKFYPNDKIFSVNKKTEDQVAWDDDFYDDSIYEFDYAVGEFIKQLKEINEYDNTIIVITSDHGKFHSVSSRIPLLIHFPNNEYSINIKNSVQILDIAPTILEYLSLKTTEWFDGCSLLNNNIDEERLIFSASVLTDKFIDSEGTKLDINLIKPPFFQFSKFRVLYCNTMYTLSLQDKTYNIETIKNVDKKCDNIFTDDYVYNVLINKLLEFGFDVSSLSGLYNSK